MEQSASGPSQSSAPTEQKPVERRFIYAADMDKMRERIEEARDETLKKAEDQFEAALKLVEDMHEAQDWKQRFEYMAIAVQDLERGVISTDELQSALSKCFQGVEEALSPEVRTSG